jgi:hypothetical protein
MDSRITWLCRMAQLLPTALLAALPAFTANELDEVEVQANRKQLEQLRQEVNRREDKIYEIFNKNNTDNQFDIICSVQAETGTLIRHKRCHPRFVQDADAADMQGFFVGYSTIPAPLIIAAKRQEMQLKMIEMLRTHPELRTAVTRYHDSKVRFDTLMKQSSITLPRTTP